MLGNRFLSVKRKHSIPNVPTHVPHPQASELSLRIANAALREGDIAAASRECLDLVMADYGPAWKLAAQLARPTEAGAASMPDVHSLLGFAMAHCPADQVRTAQACRSGGRAGLGDQLEPLHLRCCAQTWQVLDTWRCMPCTERTIPADGRHPAAVARGWTSATRAAGGARGGARLQHAACPGPRPAPQLWRRCHGHRLPVAGELCGTVPLAMYVV